MKFFGNNQGVCVFCRNTAGRDRRLVGGLGSDIYICDKCVAICQELLEQQEAELMPIEIKNVPTPSEFKQYLDSYVIGQEEAKKNIISSSLQSLQTNVCFKCIKNG